MTALLSFAASCGKTNNEQTLPFCCLIVKYPWPVLDIVAVSLSCPPVTVIEPSDCQVHVSPVFDGAAKVSWGCVITWTNRRRNIKLASKYFLTYSALQK